VSTRVDRVSADRFHFNGSAMQTRIPRGGRSRAAAVLPIAAVIAVNIIRPAAGLAAAPSETSVFRFASTAPEARDALLEGRIQLFGFNHDEAIRAFRRAASLDPECAMAHWGVATACGPHINKTAVALDASLRAVAAVTAARSRMERCSPLERALIDAASKRWADPPPQDRTPLDRAYADAMNTVWKQFPAEPDVGALFAESLMNLRPWDLWDSAGNPRPETPVVIETLESVFKLDPNHPLALHLYIHAVEASPNPEKADQAAERLRQLNLDSGHLVHMPSHIDVRRGRWQAAIESNEKAVAIDRRYVGRVKDQGFYRIYMAHNRHMLAFAAMMQGESKRALDSMRTMLAEIPEEWLKDDQAAGFVDGLFAMPVEVLVRFGRWDDVLKEPEPAPRFPVARALWQAARGVALTAQGKTTEARASQAEFRRRRRSTPESAIVGNNTAADVLAVADDLLEGELLIREGKVEAGIAALRAGVGKEDALKYDEPPDWIHPVRHALGAALIRADRSAEAEQVYREDLKRWPNNGWSLFGLADSLRRQGKSRESDDVRNAFNETWKRADVTLRASCFCQADK
jgi:tetratricopeptide (TPR) repeat protein